jgi:hypothetical protein
VQSQCAPRSVSLTCPNYIYSTGALLKDGWKVSHGLNAMDNGGSTDPNNPDYILSGDTLTNQQKHDRYNTKLSSGLSYYATYDPLNVTGSASVRPVVTLSQSSASTFNTATFTFTRDVGGDANGNAPADLAQRLSQPLTIYYAVGGNLNYGVDFTLTPAPAVANGIFSVQIPGGQTSVTVTAALTPAAVPQGTASLIVTLTPYTSVQ